MFIVAENTGIVNICPFNINTQKLTLSLKILEKEYEGETTHLQV